MIRKGFTLIELLVVIAIIAVLAVVVILVLNPAALLQQSRDANRLSDLATMNSAFNLYSEDVTGSSLGTASTSYISVFDSSATSTTGDQCQGLSLPSLGSSTYECAASSSYKSIAGTGWVPVNLKLISSGSPLGTLPVDPINQTSSGLYYSYASNGTQFEVAAVMESQKYRTQLSQSPMSFIFPGVAALGSSLSVSPLWNPSGLVGYWNFEEGSGTTVLDQSGSGNNGTWLHGFYNPTHYVSGKVGNYAGYFSQGYCGNTDNWVSVASSPSLLFGTGSFTISYWFDPASGLNGYGGFSDYYTIGKSDGNNDPGFLGWYTGLDYRQNGVMTAGVDDGSVFKSGLVSQNLQTQLNGSAWAYLTYVISVNNSINFYLNGTNVGSSSISGTTGPIDSANPLVMCTGGANNAGSYMVFDDVRIYNRALSAAEIAAIYNAQK